MFFNVKCIRIVSRDVSSVKYVNVRGKKKIIYILQGFFLSSLKGSNQSFTRSIKITLIVILNFSQQFDQGNPEIISMISKYNRNYNIYLFIYLVRFFLLYK